MGKCLWGRWIPPECLTGREQDAALTRRPSRSSLPASFGRKLTSTLVFSQHPGQFLLCIELLLDEEGAAHIHQAAGSLSVLSTELSLLLLPPLRS